MGEIEKCIGKTFVSYTMDDFVIQSEERYVGEVDNILTLDTADGERLHFGHQQDCYESVYLEDTCGDLEDLLDTPILRAVEVHDTSQDRDCDSPDWEGESMTWTFYKLDTVKGGVTLRFCGESNGYYSESVDVVFSTGN